MYKQVLKFLTFQKKMKEQVFLLNVLAKLPESCSTKRRTITKNIERIGKIPVQVKQSDHLV